MQVLQLYSLPCTQCLNRQHIAKGGLVITGRTILDMLLVRLVAGSASRCTSSGTHHCIHVLHPGVLRVALMHITLPMLQLLLVIAPLLSMFVLAWC